MTQMLSIGGWEEVGDKNLKLELRKMTVHCYVILALIESLHASLSANFVQRSVQILC